MTPEPPAPARAADPAALAQPTPAQLVLSGAWTALGIGAHLQRQMADLRPTAGIQPVADASAITALDTAGAWVLHKMLQGLRREGGSAVPQGLAPGFARLLAVVEAQARERALHPPQAASPAPGMLHRLGRGTAAVLEEAVALLSFVGESAGALAGCLRHPSRLRWRPLLFNIRTAGFDALPIVGLLSFLLGIVVAYQGADQLRQYGANIFVADLIGVSMLREFAPLITAIIIAGRSGSAYAAQIGTMAVTEEIDALRTLGIPPLELLVLPKLLALLVALPLLTVFADALGVFGGMLMARAQLAVSYTEFLDRFVKAVSVSTFMVGLAKAPVFALIIAVVGCFQGFRTRGGADSVGRQTTRSVVQSIFLVIVADALFSVAFSVLDI
jgi:phospholipid/cholesterol/gamma-HCH transport system permease protein